MRLDSKQGVLAGGDSGPVLVVGKPNQSLLIEAVSYQNHDLQMPPRNKLAAEHISALEKWVRIGAPDPRAEPIGKSTQPTGMTVEDGRQFWAFKPVRNPPIPKVKNTKLVHTAIDAFVVHRLQQLNLSPVPRADKRTLIRRATFDLIGLPPTPAEVTAFENDTDANAFEKVVDRLLSSPHYGVRWGRHWLDVARYADSNGLDENLAYGNAWRYRDYVVSAFNNDKPWDQFVTEQLAGDLLPAANNETKTATAFLALGAKVLAEPDMEKLVMDTIDEQLDTTGKAFMGLTIGCVRCHDHKFDPLLQTDYYSLAAIFKSTQTFAKSRTGAIKHWFEHSFADDTEKASLKKVEADIKQRNSAASTFKNKELARIRASAKSKAADYLVAATRFEPSDPFSVVTKIAKPLGLHPRILHHCRLHLEYTTDGPVFGKWHELAATCDAEEIERHFRTLFARMESARKQPAAQKKSVLNDPLLEAARKAIDDPSGFLAVPPKVDFAFDPETLAEYNRLRTAARQFESAAADESASLGVQDGDVIDPLPIHIRGSHLNLGTPVPREFPEVMRVSSVRPIFPAQGSGRLQFARWLANSQHPLTARVYVNRVWGWHFGRALVGTTENFGRLGDRPTHPDLLDWLAHDFMSHGWKTKRLHRQIMLSNTYQAASKFAGNLNSEPAKQASLACLQADPENKLLWKFRTQRLDAEQVRDSILFVSGRLNESFGGKTVPLRNRQFVFNHTSEDHTKYDSLRRAIYLPVIRNNLYSLFTQFDFPDPTMPTGHRATTTVAPQALWLMNSGLVLDSADALAAALLSEFETVEARIQQAYHRCLSRPATEAEIRKVQTFLETANNPRGWSMFCQSLLASNEFIYVR